MVTLYRNVLFFFIFYLSNIYFYDSIFITTLNLLVQRKIDKSIYVNVLKNIFSFNICTNYIIFIHKFLRNYFLHSYKLFRGAFVTFIKLFLKIYF